MKEFLRLLLSSGLIFIAATASTRSESLCYQKSEYVIPMHYDIKLTPYIEKNIFYGEYNISINILNKTQHIYLHSEQVCIKNIVLITNFESYHENDKDIVFKPAYITKQDTIYIYFMDELSSGNYILNIKYFGIADKGFRIFNMNEKTTWVGALHFRIIGARSIFRKMPCLHLHDLWLEATFNISIKCNLCAVLSNMPLRSTELDEHNMIWKHFDTTPVMWTDHATMIVSNYLIPIDTKTRNIKMWCRFDSKFHMEFAKNVIENITLFLNNKWKHSNNISKVDVVAIPNFHDKGTIVFGLVLYRETDIIYDKNLYPVANKFEVAQLVGRKVTQQWFNNMMNNPLVSDFWFKKGVITLLAIYAVKKTYPDYRIIHLFVVQNQHYSFNLDGDYHMWPLTSQDDSLLEIRQSIRAPFILRMMQNVFTKKIFWNGIRSYVNSTQLYHRSFENFMREVVPESRKSDMALRTMEYWASEEHCPLVKIIRYYDNPTAKIVMSVPNFDILETYCLPITFTTQTYGNFNNFSHISLTTKNFELTLPFKEDGWMIFNIQQTGYYRVNYDDENWQRISNYLKSDNYTKIHVLNRAQIIDDAFRLMIAGHLHSSIFWNIIPYLQQEEDYIAWYPMFKALEYMFSTFPVAVLEEYRTWPVRFEVLQRIKYEEIDDRDELTTCLRQEAAKWACLFGNITCKREAYNKLRQHLLFPTEHKLLPWWKEWTYCKGLMIAKKRIWKLVYDIGLNNTKYVEFLACTENTDIIMSYLSPLTFTQREYLSNDFLHIITKHANNLIILQHILDYFQELKPKHINTTAALIIIINNIYSENLIKKIKEYLERLKVKANLVGETNITEDILKRRQIMKDFIMISDKIQSKIKIRNDQINRQIRYYENIRFKH